MGGGGGGGGDRKSYSLYKEPIGARSGIESDFGPTMPSREQRGYQKYAAAGDHYYVGNQPWSDKCFAKHHE